MLTSLRRLANTWVAKVLFGLLVLSFGVWGIGDMVRNFGRDDAIARVSGQPIEFTEAQQTMRRQMQSLSRQLGAQFENDPRVRQAIAEQSVDALVMDRVLGLEGRRLHTVVPDQAVRDFVFALPGFRGGDGSFSRPVFEGFIRNSGLTEQQFLNLVRADLQRQQMTNAVRAGAAAPELLAERLYRWLQEQRGATLVVLPMASAPEPPTPEPAQLQRFHENNPERFSSPEYREAVVAVLSADRMMREVEISDDDLRQAYDARQAQYAQGERRQLEQALVPDEAKAREIAAAWRGGQSFAEIASAAQQAGGAALDLGLMAADDLPVPELATAAFAAAVGGVTDPVRSEFGWHVLRVVRAEAAVTRTLDQVRDELRQELAAEKAADLAFERANRIEDALAGGATLAEVAQRFNLGLATVRTDATGHAEDGSLVELPVIEAARPAVLRSIFATERGAAPRLQEGEAGFVAVDVRDVVPPALKPFAQVEEQVREAWVADAKRRSLEERAAALLAATRDGKTLAQAAQEAGLGSRSLGGLTRQPQQVGLVPPELVAPLFEAALNGTTMVPVRDGFAVAQVTEITAPDAAADAAAVTAVRRETAQSMAQDIEVQLLQALRDRADVRINRRLLEQLAQP